MEGGRRLLCNSSLSPPVSASGSTSSSSSLTQPPSLSSLTPSSSPLSSSSTFDSSEIRPPSPPTTSLLFPMKIRDFCTNHSKTNRASISSCSSVESYSSSTSSGASSLYSSYTYHSSHDNSLSSVDENSITSRFQENYNCSNFNSNGSSLGNTNTITNPGIGNPGKLDISRKWSLGANSSYSCYNNSNSLNGFNGVSNGISSTSNGVKTLQDRFLTYKNGNTSDLSSFSDNESQRSLIINDLDFSDLNPDDDTDVLSLCSSMGALLPPMTTALNSSSPVGSIPPPPPPPPPPPTPSLPVAETAKSIWKTNANWKAFNSKKNNSPHSNSTHSGTVKLFWKEIKEEKSILNRFKKKKSIWDEIKPVPVDIAKLEYLFENRSKDILCKKTQEGKKSELLILDAKRSNAINIGLTKLPAPKAVKNAILKMDSTIINREGIERVLSMIPTEEEKNLILEAQNDNPDLPLGSAESFLQTLSTISALEQRLKLWAFRLDFAATEEEMGEQLMDLKMATEEIERSDIFKMILGTLLSMGNFLNGMEAKGFQLEYLAMVPKVKDTVYKHSLLYHVATFIYEKHPESSDLYSELGAVIRASHIDFDELSKSLTKLEYEYRVSWDRLRVISETSEPESVVVKNRMTDFLNQCMDRISVLQVVQRRVLNRFRKTLLYLGFSSAEAKELKPNSFLKILAEFALEYRTNREKVKELTMKRESHRQYQSIISNKNRAKTSDSPSSSPSSTPSSTLLRSHQHQQVQDSELKQILSGPEAQTEQKLPRKLTRNFYSLDCSNDCKEIDEDVSDSLVKTLTTTTTTSSFQRQQRMQRMRKQSSTSTCSTSSTEHSSSTCSSSMFYNRH